MGHTEQQARALRDSITEWENKRKEENPEEIMMGINGCPCCTHYHVWGELSPNTFENCCRGCPIAKAVNEIGCEDTPYQEAHATWEEWLMHPDNSSLRDEWHAAADKEIEFLKSLVEV